jgi:hypothetical protein
MKTLYERLKDAIQFADEMEGAQSREEYINAMRMLADECLRRADVCEEVDADEKHDAMVDWYWARGWTIEQTGGGCEAFRKALDGGGFVLVTDEEDAALPASLEAPVLAGFYTDEDSYHDGKCNGFITARNIADAMQKIDAGQWEEVK